VDDAPRGKRRWIELGSIMLFASALCAWTWRGWADPLVDYGRELYGAWRLSQGDRLGIDLAWLQGPLSVECNAVLFRVFGPGYRTLFFADLAVLAAVVALVRSLLCRAWGPTAATAGAIVLLAVCAFGQYAVVGNYAFAAPYSHELTHGFLLALLGLWALERRADGGPLAFVVLAGASLGALALTKAEVFLGAVPAIVVRFVLQLPGERTSARRARSALCLLVAALVPPLACFLAFLPGRTSAEAWSATLGALAYVRDPRLLALPFYRTVMGIDAPAENVDRMLRWTLGWIAVFGVPALVARFSRAPFLRSRTAAIVAALLGTLAVVLARDAVDWTQVGQAFPLLALAIVVDAGVELARARDGRERRREAARVAFGLFALALLAKIVLNTRLEHYGFVLALPAALASVATLVEVVPRWVAARGGAGRALCGFYLGLVLAYSGERVVATREWVRLDRHELGEGADRMRVATRGKLAAEALSEIRSRCPPGSTLLVLPEGVTLNYLARLRSPTRYLNFMPPEILLFGEDAILAELVASPPDLVAVVHKDTSEYGFPLFGRDYASRLWEWVQTGYEPCAVFGDPPLVDGRFGIALLARR
jgi:hypothetical protein